jgi:hypothetical protein
MGDVIPFFYYDILARIIPGVMVLAVLRCGGLRMPEVWGSLLTVRWGTVMAPLAIAGAAYVIGVLLEAIWYIPGFRQLDEWVSNQAFDDAFREYKWLNPAPRPDSKVGEGLKRFPDAAWERLTLEGAEKPLVFAHAHRFQAEMKLCRHALLPVAGFVVLVLFNQSDCSIQSTHIRCWYLVLGPTTALLFAWGAYARERRRWWQVLICADHFQWPRLPNFPPAQFSPPRETDRKTEEKGDREL